MMDMNAFALIREIALDEIGVAPDTFRKWKERRKVPHRWRLDIILAARKRDIELHPNAFDEFADHGVHGRAA